MQLYKFEAKHLQTIEGGTKNVKALCLHQPTTMPATDNIGVFQKDDSGPKGSLAADKDSQKSCEPNQINSSSRDDTKNPNLNLGNQF